MVILDRKVPMQFFYIYILVISFSKLTRRFLLRMLSVILRGGSERGKFKCKKTKIKINRKLKKTKNGKSVVYSNLLFDYTLIYWIFNIFYFSNYYHFLFLFHLIFNLQNSFFNAIPLTTYCWQKVAFSQLYAM